MLDFPGLDFDSGGDVTCTITITIVDVLLRNIIYSITKPKGLFKIYFIKLVFDICELSMSNLTVKNEFVMFKY